MITTERTHLGILWVFVVIALSPAPALGQWVTNPDGNLVTPGADVQVGIGTQTPGFSSDGLLELFRTGPAELWIGAQSDTFWHAPRVQTWRARAFRQPVQSGDELLSIAAFGVDAPVADSIKVGAEILFTVDGAVTPQVVPTRVAIFTTDPSGMAAERLRLTSEGLLGIGTTNPAAQLTVARDVNGQEISLRLDVEESAVIPGTPGIRVPVGTVNAMPGGVLALQTQGGPVGIGTNTPLRTLHVQSPSVAGLALESQSAQQRWDLLSVDGPDSSGHFALISFPADPAEARPVMRVKPTGEVGIGTTDPQDKLHVEGNLRVNGNIVSDGDICIGSC